MANSTYFNRSELQDFLNPRLLSVPFDTKLLTPASIDDEEFLSASVGEETMWSPLMASTYSSTTGVSNVDDLFVIDKKGDFEGKEKRVTKLPDNDDGDAALVKTRLSDLRPSLYISTDVVSTKAKLRELHDQWAEDALLKKLAIPDDAEKSKTVTTQLGKRAAKRERIAQREKTAGEKWFDMAKPELTDERRQDLDLLSMRKILDTKTFYKKGDIQKLPKYFEVGTVVNAPADFYSDRIPKKQRKQTLVEELLADEQFKKQNKKRYRQALERQQYTSSSAYLQLKRLKRKEESKSRKRRANQ